MNNPWSDISYIIFGFMWNELKKNTNYVNKDNQYPFRN
jgi:hypothetical protein